MNLLAIDTCTEVCSVSLYVKGKKTNRIIQNVKKSSGLILPLCDEVFKNSNIVTKDLDGIVYTKGPGAFTGIRVCIGVVQGLSLAFDTPTLGFSTLEVMAYGAAKKYNTNKIAIALDARMNEVYWAYYTGKKILNESLKRPTEVDILDNSFFGVGSGWNIYGDILSNKSKVSNFATDFHPQADNLIDLALLNTNLFTTNLARPTYLRNNVVQSL